MTRDISTKEYADEISKRRAFKAIANFVKAGDIDTEEAGLVQAAMFGFFLKKAREARNEVQRTNAVLSRIASICERAQHSRRWKPDDPNIQALAQEMMALDGWVMSLYETDLTMISFGAPERGAAKANEMAKSMEALRLKRIAELNLGLKSPELFRIG